MEFTTGFSETPVQSRQKYIQFMVHYDLPEVHRENLSLAELAKIHGVFCQNFTGILPVGSKLRKHGFIWLIDYYEFEPTTYRSHETKYICDIFTEFYGIAS